jgi:hypothetical protein
MDYYSWPGCDGIGLDILRKGKIMNKIKQLILGTVYDLLDPLIIEYLKSIRLDVEDVADKMVYDSISATLREFQSWLSYQLTTEDD